MNCHTSFIQQRSKIKGQKKNLLKQLKKKTKNLLENMSIERENEWRRSVPLLNQLNSYGKNGNNTNIRGNEIGKLLRLILDSSPLISSFSLTFLLYFIFLLFLPSLRLSLFLPSSLLSLFHPLPSISSFSWFTSNFWFYLDTITYLI